MKSLATLRVIALGSLMAAALAQAAGNSYQQHNLVSDGTIPADHTDRNLVNAWGIAFNPTAFVWVTDNKTGVSTLYDGFGNPQSLVVAIPGPDDTTAGSPTGIVFNGFPSDFTVNNAASAFIFATEEGVIAAWAPTVDRTHAIRKVARPDTVYKGLALAGNGTANFLYAADFRGAKIDVYDRNFALVSAPGGFRDPTLPKGFAPFNIHNIQGNLYVAYAKQDDAKMDEVAGAGLGFVDVFDANGRLIRRVASRGRLNAPWGLALAPANFGRFSNRLLVGNFGDGAILAFDPHSGEFLGRLRTPEGKRLQIDGLWALVFGNGLQNQPTSTLFFTAGPDDENHGLYGTITPAPGGRDDDRDHDDDD
ncbi:MAG TPA: TIGR03118 family protein [Burkholderiales bacterium]|nr:TIGR03118 family protein [Burkholderiales bacterium]